MPSSKPPSRPSNLPEEPFSGAASRGTPARRITVRRMSEEAEPQDYMAPPVQATVPRAGRGGCFWVSRFLIVLVVGLVVVAGTLILTSSSAISSLLGGVANALSPAPAAQVTSSTTIVNSIQPLGELVTVNAQLAKADLHVSITQGVLNACSFSTSYVAQGSINAGIDFLQIGPEDIAYNELTRTYTITLPAPRVLGCSIDYIDQYNNSTTLCAVDWDTARQLGQYTALQQFRTDALESGLLDRASRQAQLVIGNFVASLTGARVDIQFARPAGDPELPPSWDPPLPLTWTYDHANQTWTPAQ